MYWPIAAPRIYAATKHGQDDELQSTSHDGTTTPTQRNKSLEKEFNRDSALAEDETDDEEARVNGSNQEEPARRKSEVAAGKEAVEHNGTHSEEAEKDAGGRIVGIAVARTGQMFITITSSTLTVWQTKVSLVATLPESIELILECSPQLLSPQSYDRISP